MSAQQSPLTYEGFLDMLRRSAEEFDRKLDRMAEEAAQRQAEAAQRQVEIDRMMAESKKESDRQFLETKQIMQENAKQMEKMRSEMGRWDSRIGRLVEHMVGGQHIGEQSLILFRYRPMISGTFAFFIRRFLFASSLFATLSRLPLPLATAHFQTMFIQLIQANIPLRTQ